MIRFLDHFDRFYGAIAIIDLRMFTRSNITSAFHEALPIILGYVAIGISCGILSASIGMNALQVLLMGVLFYSGAGQFMIPNMWLAGSPIGAIIASVSLVNTRQMLYSASFAPWPGRLSSFACWPPRRSLPRTSSRLCSPWSACLFASAWVLRALPS